MAKSKKVKVQSSATEPSMPCQSDLHGVSHKGFTKFEEIALRAMTGMLANPGLLQLDLTPEQVQANVITGSLQMAAIMIQKFDEIKQIL